MEAHDTPVSAVLTDVDGTLVTKEKVLTERALAAVGKLRERGIVFTITSGRPPFGMRMLVEPLRLTMPMAAFNGGVIVLPDLSVLDERTLPEYLLPALIDMIESHGLHVFMFRSYDWFVKSLKAPRVAREAWRTRLTLACAMGDSAAKSRALDALRADPGLSPARRAALERLALRCLAR